jgi:hypothetical protein
LAAFLTGLSPLEDLDRTGRKLWIGGQGARAKKSTSSTTPRTDWMEREGKNGDVQIVLNREAIERARLRVETRKWVLTKLRPDRFGDKIEQTQKGDSAFLALWLLRFTARPPVC